IAITKSVLQRSERRLPSAVAWSDVLHFECIVQRADNRLDVSVARRDEMKSASDDVNTRVDGGARLNDLIDAGMRTANDHHQAVRRIDGQRQLEQLQCSRLLGNQCN